MTVTLPAGDLAIALLAVWAFVVAIAFFALTAWEDLVVAAGRRKLFEVRDELFLLFAESRVGIDCPAHREARAMLNSLIRHAHRLTWWRLVASRVLLSRMGASRALHIAELRETAPDLAKHVDRLMCDAYAALFNMLESRSLLLIWVPAARAIQSAFGHPSSDHGRSAGALNNLARAADEEERALPGGHRLRAA